MKKVNLKTGSSIKIIESNIRLLLKEGFSYDEAEEISMKKAKNKKESHRKNNKRLLDDSIDMN